MHVIECGEYDCEVTLTCMNLLGVEILNKLRQGERQIAVLQCEYLQRTVKLCMLR